LPDEILIANGIQPRGTRDRPMDSDDAEFDDTGIGKENEAPILGHDGQAKESVIQRKSGTADNPIDLDETDSDEESGTNKCSKRRVPGASAQKGRKQAKKRPRQALKQLECDLILSPMKTRSRGNVRSTRGINR
jgi:hypothetical protein